MEAGTIQCVLAPEGRWNGRARRGIAPVRRPVGAGFLKDDAHHGLRCAPPVATFRDPFGVEMQVIRIHAATKTQRENPVKKTRFRRTSTKSE